MAKEIGVVNKCTSYRDYVPGLYFKGFGYGEVGLFCKWGWWCGTKVHVVSDQ